MTVARRTVVPAIRLPDVDAMSTGLGLLAAAVFLVVPLVVGPPTFDDATILGIDLSLLLALAGLIVAVAAVIDLVGRTELRQGIGVLGLAGLFASSALLFFATGAALDPEGSEELRAFVPYGIVVIWASSLVVGTIAFGPTRTAVLIGLITIAIALLLPIGPDRRPFLGYALDSVWSYVLAPAAAAGVVSIWRLLDLPRIGGLVLGAGLAIFTQVWMQGAPAVAAVCPPGVAECLQPGTIQLLVWAGCLFVAFGTMLGRPSPDLDGATGTAPSAVP